MKTIKKFLFLISAFFALFSFGDCADCEAYKTQVVNDCNALDSSLQSVANNVNSAVGFANSGFNSSTDPNDKAIFATITATLANTQGYIDSVSAFVSSIRATAQSLQCNASSNTVGSCDCSQYLQTLIGLVQTCNQTVASVKSGVDSLVSSIGTVGPDDSDIVSTVNAINNTFDDLATYIEQFLSVDGGELPYTVSDFYTIFSDFHSSITNYSSSKFSTQNKMSYKFMSNMRVLSDLSYLVSPLSYFARPTSSAVSFSLKELLFAGFQNLMLQGSSLNNFSYTNLSEFVKSRQYLHSIDTNIVSLSSKFSIFNDFVFSAEAPLSMYTDKDTDGSYHDYLTNYYIKVSKGQQSGSDSFTNWFSRVELLLAALVFQDEDDSTINTNGVPSESDKNSVTEIGSSLDQTISAFVQDGNSHVSSVDTSGKSIIRMVTSWNTAIGQTAKPAPFVVAEFTAPDSQSRSNISLWLDTEDEKLSSLIEIGHGISTLAWVAVFLLLGYNLAVYSIRVLRKLISFSFSLYSAIFGGG